MYVCFTPTIDHPSYLYNLKAISSIRTITIMTKKNSTQWLPQWSYRDGIHAFLLFIALNTAVLAIELLVYHYGLEHFFVTTNDALNLTLLYLVTLVTFIIPVLWLAQKKKLSWSDSLKAFSFKKLSLKQAGKMVLLGYALLFATGILIVMISQLLPFEIPGLNPQEDLPFFAGGTDVKIVGAIIAIIFAPIIEEIFFRGMLLPTLLTRYSFTYASMITSAVFALLHLQPESILGIFILSLVLNYIYKRGGYSITNTIAFHMVNNTVAMILLMNMDKLPL